MSRRWPRRAVVGVLCPAFLASGWLGWWSPARDWRVATGWEDVPNEERPQKAEPRGDGMPEIRWLGHAGFVIRWSQTVIALDPNTSPRCKVSPRVLEAPRDLADLGTVDAALISHAHYDHLDLPTLRKLPHLGAVIVPQGSETYVEGELDDDVEIVPLGLGSATQIGDVEVVAVEARHNGNRFHPFASRKFAVGYVLKRGEITLYFAGDTGFGDHFARIRDDYHPDVAILPIGAYAPRWPLKHYHLSPEEAVEAARILGVRSVVPAHFGTFMLSLDRPASALPRFAHAAHLAGVRWSMPELL